jgi:hypothetical protein
MRLRGGALALVVCAASTACTSAVAGTPVRPGEGPGSAAAVLGDFATYDPCSVVDPSAFDEFGEAGIIDDRRSFEMCPLSLTTDDGLLTISVGRLGVPGKETERIAELGDGRWIGQWYESASYCTQGLVFTDDVVLEVGVGGGVDLCAVAEAGVRMVADVLDAGPADHHDYPENSLALHDPCDMVTDDVVRDLPAYDKARRDPAPAGHTCSWSQVTHGAATTLSVSFTIGSPPAGSLDEDEERDIAGRQTVVSPFEGESGAFMCTVSTAHILSDLSDRRGAVELAEVSTYAPANGTLDCTSAVTVATEVWERLPER